MTPNQQNKFKTLVKGFLLPLVCLYLVFSVPVNIYKSFEVQFAELQEQAEEKKCCGLCENAEALLQGSLQIEAHPINTIHLHSETYNINFEDFTRGIHRPPER